MRFQATQYVPFWMVWNEESRGPTFKHPDEAAARAEAERLARAVPGREFHVLMSIAKVCKTDVIWHDADLEITVPDCVPF